MRDITLGITFYQFFTTRAFDSGIPFTLANTPVISAYEDNNDTQITAGISLSVDFDGVTGLNLITVVATSGNTYENGKSYALVITTGTVDSVSVIGEVVGEFTIGQSASAVDLANVTDGLSALKDLIDAIPTTAMRGTDNVVLSGPTEAQMNTAHSLLATPAQVNTQVDAALNTAIPGSPTADSINERIAAIDDLTEASGDGDLAAMLAAVDALEAQSGKVIHG